MAVLEIGFRAWCLLQQVLYHLSGSAINDCMLVIHLAEIPLLQALSWEFTLVQTSTLAASCVLPAFCHLTG
jgi:hypothetical protein